MREENLDLLLSSYSYDLPPELIAQRPADRRDHSRLLVYNEETDSVTHAHFYDLPNYLPQGAGLVLNNSRVFPCRLKANKETGGKVELFFLELFPKDGSYQCLIKSSAKKRLGESYIIGEGITAKIIELNSDGTFQVELSTPLEEMIDSKASVPIPPYIRDGESDAQDLADYQTIFARQDEVGTGSVAAPTAGLHFTDTVFKGLKEKGIEPHYVTLHVGLGTFRPVKAEKITDHEMHAENFFVEKDQWERIKNLTYKVAVGTTSLRVLESLKKNVKSYDAPEIISTNIFLHPGVAVESIDAMITNFHLPESSLIMLVSSLIGREKTMELYELAVKDKYRFFSYGDAMLILRKKDQK